MTEHETIAGNVYCVTCAEGCTVTDSSGQLNEECEAGKQLHVTAPSGVLYTSAPATVRKVNFKNAPVKLKLLGLLGGGVSNGLPSGYLQAEFLKSTGTQYIDSAFVPTKETEIEATAILRNGAVFAALVSRYGTGASFIDASGTVYWRFFGLSSSVTRQKNKSVIKLSKNGLFIDGVQQAQAGSLGSYNPASLAIFASKWGDGTFNNLGQLDLFSMRITENGESKFDFIPTLDNTGTPCMYNRVTKQPFYNKGSGSFIVGMTIAQARQLGKLPATGGTLTVSLPSNYAEDEGVVNALATAQKNGWKITIQTYEAETGAASTFALRRIWVRKRADDQGSYVDTDGFRWQVDWCVDIVGADPEQEGYEPFRSVESATEYWGLTPWVDPEQEDFLTNTEEV